MYEESQRQMKPFLEMSGYQPKTTFFMDFNIADHFGEDAVRNTYKTAFKHWKDNIEYLTELVLVLNWRLWLWHDAGNDTMAKLYDSLWREADQWCMDNLKGDDLSYYLRTTD